MSRQLKRETYAQSIALHNYNAFFDNSTYQAVQIAIISDLYGDYFAHDEHTHEELLSEELPNFLMNTFIDVALEICGLPSAIGKHHTLVNLAALLHE